MQMYPRDHGGYKEQYYAAVEEDYVFKDDCNYNRGSTMHMMKPDQFKHNYDQYHGYGGHGDHHKNGREGYSAQYSENWYEEERRGDAWNVRNDYSGHGGKHHNGYEYGHNGGIKHHGYGAHEGHHGPHREQQYRFSECSEERNKRAPVWEFKGIRD